MDEISKKIIGITMYIFHFIAFIVVLIGPYITNNVFYLSILIFINILILYLWYTFGECLFSIIEEKLLDTNYRTKDGTRKSFIAVIFEKIVPDENITKNMSTLYLVINSTVCLWKINTLFYSRKR